MCNYGQKNTYHTSSYSGPFDYKWPDWTIALWQWQISVDGKILQIAVCKQLWDLLCSPIAHDCQSILGCCDAQCTNHKQQRLESDLRTKFKAINSGQVIYFPAPLPSPTPLLTVASCAQWNQTHGSLQFTTTCSGVLLLPASASIIQCCHSSLSKKQHGSQKSWLEW